MDAQQPRRGRGGRRCRAPCPRGRRRGSRCRGSRRRHREGEQRQPDGDHRVEARDAEPRARRSSARPRWPTRSPARAPRRAAAADLEQHRPPRGARRSPAGAVRPVVRITAIGSLSPDSSSSVIPTRRLSCTPLPAARRTPRPRRSRRRSTPAAVPRATRSRRARARRHHDGGERRRPRWPGSPPAGTSGERAERRVEPAVEEDQRERGGPQAQRQPVVVEGDPAEPLASRPACRARGRAGRWAGRCGG